MGFWWYLVVFSGLGVLGSLSFSLVFLVVFSGFVVYGGFGLSSELFCGDLW